MSQKQPSRAFVGVDMALDPDETAMVVAEVGEVSGMSPEAVSAVQDFVKVGALAVAGCMESMTQVVRDMSLHFQAFSDALGAIPAETIAQMEFEEAEEEDDGWGGWPLGDPGDG